jgi:hypothetical protein
LRRDADFLDAEIVGLACDTISQRVWCTDARAGRLFTVSLAPGNEGVSTTGADSYSALLFDEAAGGPPAVGVVPSGVAFDGGSLYLVHAVDRDTDSSDDNVGPKVRRLSPAVVDPSGNGTATVLDSFGVTLLGPSLPEGPASITDGDMFLRFKLLIDGEKLVGSTQFSNVSVDNVGFIVENQAF